MLLPGLQLERAAEVAERLRQAISGLVIPSEVGVFSFTASMGVASFCPPDKDFTGLLSRADVALYEAKNGGRNCVIMASGNA